MTTINAALPPVAARRRGSKVNGGYKPFGQVLRDRLIETGVTTRMGNPNWSAFAELLDTVHYETLRKAIVGERQPSPKVMEETAAALGENPADLFVEYRIWQAQRQFDPREVGEEAALAALEEWAKFQNKRR